MFSFASVNAEIKYKDRDDLAIVYSEKPFFVKAVFTKNKFRAAPVNFCIDRLKKNKKFNAIIVNSGNANACTGKQGYLDCELIERKLKEEFQIENGILIASTGVIGVRLPLEKICKKISILKKNLSSENYEDFAKAIMTTDTVPKIVEYKNGKFRIFGIAKGAGMIHPNMATMLAFIFTNANIELKKIDKAFKDVIDRTFNSISVDGDTSTNDSVFLSILPEEDVEFNEFINGLRYVCENLAKKIVEDGEGSTKFIEINVINGNNKEKCKQIAETIAKSPLVKTAFFGNDPNWGRIICAVGYSNVNFNPENIILTIGQHKVFENGMESPEFSEEKVYEYLKNNRNVSLTVNLNEGKASWKYYTCDFSYEYVKINAEYRT